MLGKKKFVPPVTAVANGLATVTAASLMVGQPTPTGTD